MYGTVKRIHTAIALIELCPFYRYCNANHSYHSGESCNEQSDGKLGPQQWPGRFDDTSEPSINRPTTEYDEYAIEQWYVDECE